MQKKIIIDLIKIANPQDKIKLLKEYLPIPQEHYANVDYIPSDNPKEFKVIYYEMEYTLSYFIALSQPEVVQKLILNKLISQKKIFDYENNPIDISLIDAKPKITMDEIYFKAVKEATSEEQISEIFDSNLENLTNFIKSKEYKELDEHTKTFLYSIIKDPFLLLWQQ